MNGFLLGLLEDSDKKIFRREKEPLGMVIPMIILAAAAVGLGIFPNALIRFLNSIITTIL